MSETYSPEDVVFEATEPKGAFPPEPRPLRERPGDVGFYVAGMAQAAPSEWQVQVRADRPWEHRDEL